MNPPCIARLLQFTQNLTSGARPSVRLCVGLLTRTSGLLVFLVTAIQDVPTKKVLSVEIAPNGILGGVSVVWSGISDISAG